MKTSGFIAALLCAGCAHVPTPEESASGLTSPALCYVHYAGNANDQAVSAAELRRRAFACSPENIAEGKDDFQRWQAAQSAERQRQAQAEESRKAFARNLGAILLLQPARPPATQCSTDRFGNTICF